MNKKYITTTNIIPKIAVILVGSHYAGKSRISRFHLKPKLCINGHPLNVDDHKFTHNGKDGWILSQSLEESGKKVADIINKYGKYDYLVLAARPIHENPSLWNALKTGLTAAGYTVFEIDVVAGMNKQYYDGKAGDILSKF